MKKIFAKALTFGLFVFIIVFLSQQTRLNNERKQVKQVSGSLVESLSSAKNELTLLLGEDSTLKNKINALSLSYDGCGSNLSLLPDFIYKLRQSVVQICNVSLLNRAMDFQERVVFEFITQHGLCIAPPNETLVRICENRDKNERFVVNRALANHSKEAKNIMTLNMDYGDKSSVFMVITGKQQKLAYKTNYGDERVVQLENEDIDYIKAQLSKVKRKFSKPKCLRKVIRLYAQNQLGQRFRSFACVDDLDQNTQTLLKLTRTVSSLSENTF